MKEKYFYIISTICAFILCMSTQCIPQSYVDDFQEFETMLAYTQQPVFVIFSAPWCGICTSFKDTLNQLTEHDIFKKTVRFVTVNFDKAKLLCTKYAVDRIPTFLYVQNGQILRKDVGVKRGVNIKEFFEKTITETFNLEPSNQKIASSKTTTLKSTVAYFVTPPLKYIKNGLEWCIEKLST